MRSIFKVCHVTKNVFKSKLKSQRLMSGVAAINEVKVFRDNQEVVERMKVRDDLAITFYGVLFSFSISKVLKSHKKES